VTCQLCGSDRFREDDGAMVCKGCGAVRGGPPVDVDLERDSADFWAREYDNETQLLEEGR
jgi:transcription initiation factor TFIIIB Brf1 subunit/transcription initiation factor TFIIB